MDEWPSAILAVAHIGSIHFASVGLQFRSVQLYRRRPIFLQCFDHWYNSDVMVNAS